MKSRGFSKILILILSLVAISCGSQKQSFIKSDSDSIVNGSSFRENETLPLSVVLLKISFKTSPTSQVSLSQCTGVLVSNRYILTAAHCVQFSHIEKSEVIYPITQTSEVYTQKQVLVHPEYKNENLNAYDEQLRDIALIKLEKLPPANYVSLPLMGLENKIPALVSFEALGFGDEHGVLLNRAAKTFQLHHAQLQTENFDSTLPYFDVTQTKRGICFGDSGGPAIMKLGNKVFVAGLAIEVLFNPIRTFEANYDRCLQKAIFLNIPYFKTWIENGIKTLDSKP